MRKKNFKLENLKLDMMRQRQLEEFLHFKLHRESELEFKFSEFNRVCGLSRQQWEVFRGDNKKLEVDWIIE